SATVPGKAADHVVAVAQRDNAAAPAHVIVGIGADETVGGRDRAGDAGRPAAPGHRPAAAVRQQTANHVVAVRKRGDAADAHLVIAAVADEAFVVVDRAGEPGRTAAPGRRPAV